ncbi:hypothetical protein DV872_04015 [Oceanispirochaeta sp. M1]|nr:hypothetical protein DV872_04015 [Oceanispirochaeta sp. M1]
MKGFIPGTGFFVELTVFTVIWFETLYFIHNFMISLNILHKIVELYYFSYDEHVLLCKKTLTICIIAFKM